MSDKNSAQADYWSNVAGPDWVSNKDMMDASMANLTARLFEHADPAPDARVLDIGCGTGASAHVLAERLNTGTILATDIAETMLVRARKTPSEKIEYVLADAQSYPFEAGSFDLVVSRFGTMFFSDNLQAFDNIRTALKPGGRLVMVCWGPLKDNPWFSVPAEAAVTQVGRPKPKDPHAPGPLAFADEERVLNILRGAGFDPVRVWTETVMMEHPDFETLSKQAAESGPAARVLMEMRGSPKDKEAIATAVRDGYAQYRSGTGAAIPARLHYFTAVNPSET